MNAPVGPKKVPRGCAWTMVVAGGLLLVMGVLSFAAIPILWRRSQEVWTETQGTLVEVYVQHGIRRSSDGSRWKTRTSYTTYDVRLKYQYQVDGKEHNGDEKALRQPEDDEKWEQAKAVLESYKAGDAIAVYYRPDKPERSRFTAKEAAIEFKKDLLFVTVYLVGGVGLVVWGRKLLRN